MKSIKERLVEEITMSGLSMKEIAKRIGVHPSMVSEYKTTKKMPSLETFALICKALDVSADYILGLTDDL